MDVFLEHCSESVWWVGARWYAYVMTVIWLAGWMANNMQRSISLVYIYSTNTSYNVHVAQKPCQIKALSSLFPQDQDVTMQLCMV